MIRTLYLCGPMTGIAHLNYPEFRRWAFELRELGFIVKSPAELGLGPEVPWELCMRRAIGLMVQAEAVATLAGYQNSAGARLECELAQRLGMPVVPVQEWLGLAPSRRPQPVAEPGL